MACEKMALLSGPPFSNPIDFVYFDLWHYDGQNQQARRVHGRSRFRAVARQLSHAAENGSSCKAMAAELRRETWQIQVSDGGVIT